MPPPANAHSLSAAAEEASDAVYLLCKQVGETLSADRVSVWLLDPSCTTISPLTYDSRRNEDLSERASHWTRILSADFGLVRQLLDGARTVVVEDATDDPRLPPELASEFGTRSLRADRLGADRPVGMLCIEPAPPPGQGPERLDRIVETLTAGARVAQAWQTAEAGRAEAELLLDLAEVSAPHQSLAALLETLCIRLARQLGVHRVCIFLEQDGMLVPRMAQTTDARRDPDAWARFIQAPEPLQVVEHVFRSGEPIAFDDPKSDLVSGWWRENFSIAAGMAVPVGEAPDVIGVMTLDSPVRRRYSHDRVRLASAVGRQLGAIVTRAKQAEEGVTNLKASEAAQRLLEVGAGATSVEQAGEILATVARDVLGTEHAVAYLGSTQVPSRLEHLATVNVDAKWTDFLRSALIGRPAHDFPLWTKTVSQPSPILVEDARRSDFVPADLVEALGLGSYVAIPLLAEEGPLGLVVCSNLEKERHWSDVDARVAQQLALEGSLVVENARLRAAEQSRLSQLAHQAFHDLLTGLPNRALLFDRLDHAVASARRSARRLALVLADLNGFKEVNDTFGHQRGDAVLRQISARLAVQLRDSDTVARLGGDEFAILVTDGVDEESIHSLIERIGSVVSQPLELDGGELAITASVGAAVFPDDAQDPDTIYHAADLAMYASKQGAGAGVLGQAAS